MSKTAKRTMVGCQTFIEHLGRNCYRVPTVEFHETQPDSDDVSALPVCWQHGRKLLEEAKTKRHRKAWLTEL